MVASDTGTFARLASSYSASAVRWRSPLPNKIQPSAMRWRVRTQADLAQHGFHVVPGASGQIRAGRKRGFALAGGIMGYAFDS